MTINKPFSKLKTWAAIGALLGLLGVILLFAPASWLASWLARASGEYVFLAEPRGTVWSGDAILVLAAGATREANLAQSKALPGRIRWQFSPTWLGLKGRVNTDCCSLEPMQIMLKGDWRGAQGWMVIPALDWPLSILEGLGAPWNTIEPQGVMSLRTQGFQISWTPQQTLGAGSLVVDVQNFASRLSTVEPLGSYKVEMKSQDSALSDLAINLMTVNGALRLEGSGLYSKGRVQFDGKAYAEPGSERQLNNLLNVIGRREGDVSLLQLR